LAEKGFEIHVEFDKGDRLKWVDQLVSEAFIQAEQQGSSISSVVITCGNTELFERNWASYLYGDQQGFEDTIAQLFLSSFANNLGMPLQWLLDEWDLLGSPRPYHRGLLKKYQRLIKQAEKQLLFRGLGKIHYRDPVLATCTDIELEYAGSDFVHLNSDELIQPMWLGSQLKKETQDLAFT